MAKTYVGIDFGTNELHLTLVGGRSVRCLLPEPLPDNLVKNGRIVSIEAMSSILQKAIKRNKISVKSCAVVLPSDLVFTRRCSLPYMTIEQLQLNLPFEFKDFIQKDNDNYFYDYAVLSVINNEQGTPISLDLMAAAVAKELIVEYRKMLQRAGLRLEVAVPECFAFRNLIVKHEQKAAAHPDDYCIVDMGHTAIRVHMFRGNAYETTRVIDFGGYALDKIISETMNVDMHVAAKYKLSNFENIQDSEACCELYNRIAIEILRAINFYNYNNPDTSLSDVFFCGGLTRVNRLMAIVRDTLKLNLHDIRTLLPKQTSGAFIERYAAALGVTFM